MARLGVYFFLGNIIRVVNYSTTKIVGTIIIDIDCAEIGLAIQQLLGFDNNLGQVISRVIKDDFVAFNIGYINRERLVSHLRQMNGFVSA